MARISADLSADRATSADQSLAKITPGVLELAEHFRPGLAGRPESVQASFNRHINDVTTIREDDRPENLSAIRLTTP